MSFQPVSLSALDFQPFHRIGKDWMLITAGDQAGVNTMTASWGGAGILWGSEVATIYVRPQRYTHQFLDAQGRFSLCFFDGYREALALLGRVSGRDRDKITEAGLHVEWIDGIPVFREASLVLLAKTLYVDEIKESCFLDPAVAAANYPEKDFHTMYIAKILEACQQAN